MCGIAGIFHPGNRIDEGTLRAMTDTLMHRGPDDSDTWCDHEAGVGFGHRRLSILDLSAAGRQPMASACGRYVICFNGEVYNHLEIREQLSGHSYTSTSDTETMLAAIVERGLEKALELFVGMFAFALWDKQERTVTLVRDRMGIKPLYFGQSGDAWLFGSELKALSAYSNFQPSIDRNALSLFFRHNYIPAPYCIYEGIRKLEPGQLAVITESGCTVKTWWSTRQVWRDGLNTPFSGNEQEALAGLEDVLTTAVKRRMISDVPLGAFLSGGIDSSLVTAIMQAISDKPIRTFSIGFKENAYNEAVHAKAVADHLGTEHTEFYVTPDDLLEVVPSMPRMWDEPFSDSSQIPTYILSRMTRDHVTVALSGDGGDELFYGYERYLLMERQMLVSRIPRPVRAAIGACMRGLPDGFYDALGPLGPKIRWRMDLLGMKDFSEYYRFFVSHFKHPESFVLGASEPMSQIMNPANAVIDDQYSQMALWDLVSYLPDDILTKVDRASMGVALEARVPILDHNVVAYAASIPTSMKVKDGGGKYLLRKLLRQYVPEELVERPKMGFGVPIDVWLRNDLREWCEDLLSEETIRKQGFLDAQQVQRVWRDYADGKANWSYYIWDILMFQAWLDEWGLA